MNKPTSAPEQSINRYAGPTHQGPEEACGAICIDGLSYRYPSGALALENIDLHVTAGSTLAIIGPNGAGKTTLLRILLGLLEGYTGRVLVEGLTPDEARRRGGIVGWTPQHHRYAENFPVTTREVVRMGLVGKTGLLRPHRREDLDYVERVLGSLGIEDLGNRPIGELSGGQRQLAMVARALAPRPRILLLDEPTVGIDQSALEHFRHLIPAIQEEFHLTLVIVSHDVRTVLSTCHGVACLNRTIHFHENLQELDPEILSQAFQCTLEGVSPALHGFRQQDSNKIEGAD